MVSVDHLDEIDHATEGVRSFSAYPTTQVHRDGGRPLIR